MNLRSNGLRGPMALVMVAGLLFLPEAEAGRPRVSSGGGHPRAAHTAARRPSNNSTNRPVRMPHVTAQSRPKVARTTNTGVAHNNTSTVRNKATTGSTSLGMASGTPSPNTYTYGTGNSARHYRARGYGRGYNNRNYGRSSGYGNSQASTRAVVSRLRSVHSSLARLDHDYNGHRAKAMHSITMAVRQLSHRSMGYRNSGSSTGTNTLGGMNNTLAQGNRLGNNALAMRGQPGNGAGANRQGRPRMSQAQSDARMSQAMRTTQGVQMQLSQNAATNSTTHARARGHIQVALHEMGTALTVR